MADYRKIVEYRGFQIAWGDIPLTTEDWSLTVESSTPELEARMRDFRGGEEGSMPFNQPTLAQSLAASRTFIDQVLAAKIPSSARERRR